MFVLLARDVFHAPGLALRLEPVAVAVVEHFHAQAGVIHGHGRQHGLFQHFQGLAVGGNPYFHAGWRSRGLGRRASAWRRLACRRLHAAHAQPEDAGLHQSQGFYQQVSPGQPGLRRKIRRQGARPAPHQVQQVDRLHGNADRQAHLRVLRTDAAHAPGAEGQHSQQADATPEFRKHQRGNWWSAGTSWRRGAVGHALADPSCSWARG